MDERPLCRRCGLAIDDRVESCAGCRQTYHRSCLRGEGCAVPDCSSHDLPRPSTPEAGAEQERRKARRLERAARTREERDADLAAMLEAQRRSRDGLARGRPEPFPSRRSDLLTGAAAGAAVPLLAVLDGGWPTSARGWLGLVLASLGLAAFAAFCSRDRRRWFGR